MVTANWFVQHAYLIPLLAFASAALTLFFGGFNFLEASFPAVIADRVDPAARGRAMGVYATLQFVGAFCGGALGGLLLGWAGPRMLLGVAAGVALAATLLSPPASSENPT